ncbi:MAG: hypothetical protein ABI824_15905 [Acidobacteriota bacterium]
MFQRFENKNQTPAPEKRNSGELRDRLASLRKTEGELSGKLQHARTNAREATERLREAEDEFVAGSIAMSALTKARAEAVNGLNSVEPIDLALREHQVLLSRCCAILAESEAEDRRQATIELGNRHADWCMRYSEILNIALQATSEGEAIVAEARWRCPELASSWSKLQPVPDLSPALMESHGYTLPHLGKAMTWITEWSTKTGLDLPEFAKKSFEPYLKKLTALEAANARMAREAAVQREQDWTAFRLENPEGGRQVSGPGGILMRA